MSHLAKIVNHYEKKVRKEYPVSLEFIYDSKTVRYFIENYLKTYFTDFIFSESLSIPKSINDNILGYIDNIITYYAFNVDYIFELFEQGYKTSIYEYMNHNYSLALAEEDYKDILLSQEYCDFVSKVFKMNPIECFLPNEENIPLEYSQLSIFMSYIHEYVIEKQTNHITIDIKEFEKVYLADIQFYTDNYLTTHTVYDKKRFRKDIVTNVDMVKNTYDVYNSLMKDEEWYNSEEHDMARNFLYEALDENIKNLGIATKSKLTNADIQQLSEKIDNFLRSTDMGLVTPDELMSNFVSNYKEFEPLFTYSELDEREVYVDNLFDNYLESVKEQLQLLSEHGILMGETNEDGIVSFPTTPTMEQLELGLKEVEKENNVIINFLPLRQQQANNEIYRILANEQNSPLQIQKLSNLLGAYASEHSQSIEEVIQSVDIEAIYDDYFSNTGYLTHSFSDFIQYVQKNSSMLLKTYRQEYNEEFSIDSFIEHILKQYDNLINRDVNFENNPHYNFALEEVFSWNSSFGITVDREKMKAYLANDGEIKREVEDIFLNTSTDDNAILELITLFDSFIPKFTTNKRYTVKDRAYILDAIRNSDRAKLQGEYARLPKKEQYLNEAQVLTNIMSLKETLLLKESRNLLVEYQNFLNQYVAEYFTKTIKNHEYFSLDEPTRKLIEEDFVNEKSNYTNVEADFEKWLYHNLQYFYSNEKKNMRVYDTKELEVAIDVVKMKEIHKQLVENENLSNEQKLNIVSEYLAETAQDYRQPLSLTEKDWETIDTLITVGLSKLHPYKRLAVTRYTKESMLKHFSEKTLLELKAQSKTQHEFENGLRKLVSSYVNSQGKELEKNRKFTKVALNMEDFPYEEKIKSLENYIVRYVEQGTQQTTYIMTRNHEVIVNYSKLTGDYIVNDFKSIDDYIAHHNLTFEGNKALALNLQTGEFMIVDFDNLIEFDRMKRVHGWLEFPIESDAWYKIAYMNVPPRRFFNRAERLAKTKLKGTLKQRILQEANRKREILLLRSQQVADKELDEYIANKEKQEEEERIVRLEKEKIDNQLNETEIEESISEQEDTSGQLLKDNLKETLLAIEETEQEYVLTTYRQKLFTNLVNLVGMWKKDSLLLEDDTQQVRGIVIDKENCRIKLNINQNVFIISPYYLLNGSYCTIYTDVLKQIQLASKIDESSLDSYHIKVINELIKRINTKESTSAQNIVVNTASDVQRLLRLKKVLKLNAQSINNEEFVIKDNIDGGVHSHLEIKVKVKTVNKETGTVSRSIFTYIYAPSIVFLQEKNMYIYKRSGNDGINLNELHSLWGEKYLGGAMNKKKLFHLLSTQDLRRKV